MPCGLRLGVYLGYFSKKCPKNSVDFPNRNSRFPTRRWQVDRWIVDRMDFVFFKICSNSSTNWDRLLLDLFFLEQAPIGSSFGTTIAYLNDLLHEFFR